MPEKPEMSKEEFFKKHPPISEEDVKFKLMEANKRKDQYTKDIEELKNNILGLQKIIEPLIDPETDKILAWMRLPTNEELEEYYFTYNDKVDLKKISKNDRKKLTNRQYELMANIIEIPKEKWDWWKKNTTPRTTRLFAIKLTSMFESLGVTMANF